MGVPLANAKEGGVTIKYSGSGVQENKKEPQINDSCGQWQGQPGFCIFTRFSGCS